VAEESLGRYILDRASRSDFPVVLRWFPDKVKLF
jgi:hypothetical protein